MMQNPLAETGGVNDAGLGIADTEGAQTPNLDRSVENILAQPGQFTG